MNDPKPPRKVGQCALTESEPKPGAQLEDALRAALVPVTEKAKAARAKFLAGKRSSAAQ